MEKCITGLRAYGIQVIRVPEFSDLETVLNAWSSHLKIAGATL
jgi:predicted Fe-Mo cluster-binding NifX family protein